MACDAKRTVEMMAFRMILRLMKIMRYLPSGFLTPGIQLPCQRMIGVYKHLLRKVFWFHYHSQKVIRSLG